ncbi:uncharacterized protein [Physcomitrium patens]|uniref:Palmitoyl-protein thioesterase 1 n=1 Tax=Physcomitrium patens TaxID=3218 RepID=A0A2K1K715_PHYPA|nr:palmitoyl-protein thioesterase 1-like [Physcomitrium patens]PNR49569.1 hypothetical protein PHYPA_011465 [Physcomitrium patens]|eukprot:XP_024382458.1 palmitoyl-protein thioesterase 1-like [Physcomitrella patens]
MPAYIVHSVIFVRTARTYTLTYGSLESLQVNLAIRTSPSLIGHTMAQRWNPQLGFVTILCCLIAAELEVATAAGPLPFIVLHGLDDQCGNDGVTEFTKALRDLSGAEGRCLSIGNGRIDSWLLRIDKQAAMVCNKIKSIPSLRNGYNIVGLSQGNMVARAVIEWCHGGPPVHNYISLGGPHAGIAAIPYCTFLPLCRFLNEGIAPLIYSPIVQSNFAPSGYFKIPSELSTYYKRAYLLPRINNEIPHVQNKSFKKRFQQLNHLVLIQFDEDLVLVPPQSAWFQYYPDNDVTLCEVLPLNESALYKEDWIGLRSLNEEGKVSFISLPSDHLSISSHQMEKYIVPYINQTSDFGSEWVLNQPRQPNNGNPISWYTNGTQVLMVSKS